jgi:hypothetical protein
MQKPATSSQTSFRMSLVDDLSHGGNFRLMTRLGDLDVFQWVSGVDADDLYAELHPHVLTGVVEGVPVQQPESNDCNKT